MESHFRGLQKQVEISKDRNIGFGTGDDEENATGYFMPLSAYPSLSFHSTIPSGCLEKRQALIPSYDDSSIRVYPEGLALIVPREVSTWKARPAFLPGQNVQIDANRRLPEDWRRGTRSGLSYNRFCWNRRIFLEDSMRLYEILCHAPRRLLKILTVQSYRVIVKFFLEGSNFLRYKYDEPEPLQLF